MAKTLVEALCEAEHGGGGIGFVAEDGARVSRPWSDVTARARRVAHALAKEGVRPGDFVATLGTTSPELVEATFGIWFAGGVPVPLPLPMRLASVEAFVAQTRARVEAADCRFVLIDPLFEGQVPEMPGITALSLARLDSNRDLVESPGPSDIALIQYTSGSTTEPRGVTLTHDNLMSSTRAMAAAAAFQPDEDVVFSWLPLYHDMGLIGTLLTPATNAAHLWLMSPQTFMSRPRLWLEAMEATGTTVTCAPNFAYAVAARLLRHGGLDLSRLRLALNGAEPIDCDTVRDFVASGAACGVRPEVPFPVYGLAEATLAVAFPSLDETFVVDTISRDAAEEESIARSPKPGEASKEVVSEGYPIPGMGVRIAGSSRDRHIGEIELRGAPVTSGYYKRPDVNSELFTDDGWLRTGDLGYFVDSRLHVTGRQKDIIIVGGRNIYPQDIEASAQEVDGVRRGNCVAFAVEGRSGREAIAVVAETRESDTERVVRDVVRRIADDHGVAPQKVVLLPPGTLPKTSSGKLQRSLTRQMLAVGEFEPVGV